MNQWQNKSRREPVQLGIRVQVEAVAMAKFWNWVDIAKGEVSCLGTVEEIRDADSGAVSALLVTDLFLVKQQCSADETTMDVVAVSQLMLDLENKGIDSRKLRCWVHSHGSMSVFWSGTDDDCISGLANGDYLLSLVVNRKRDTMMRLDQYHPCHLYLTDIVWDVHYPLIDGLAEQCLTEFKAKVLEDTHGVNGHRQLARDTQDHVQDLRAAHDRGALTMEELQEELDWYYPEDLDREERPF
ncbi:MAG TPA: hypothetical protein VGL38_08155 [bacterium]|jgi:hypothetical protein